MIGLKIWIVDDEEPNREVMQRMLAAEGYEITCFETAETVIGALTEPARKKPDILITDFNLSTRLTGEDVARAGKEMAISQIIIVSGNPENETIARELGIAFLGKPFTKESLVALVKWGKLKSP